MSIKYFNLNPKVDRLLLAKLNAVAPYERRRPHNLGKLLLETALDELIRKHKINLIPAQPAELAG